MDSFDVKLLRRSIGQTRTHLSVKPLYGDKTWVTGLDIVNELGGHTGCVNALSWSTGGNLLASGSDDTHLNIWEYNPANIARPFTLNTSVSTGHHANIFSVKFMPHSNDRTVVTCAGDSEVRVFDLEYAGADATAADSTASTRSRRFNDFFPNTKWLNEANTNARVYRSHSDRAKRIVTESSPHFFLSCSEDGEVRQWDLRQPSGAYPSPLGSRRRLGRSRMVDRVDDEAVSTSVPPPLISYKRYGLDINTISCSSSQPHYIALGGAHLHCFLHDRRMLGRDLVSETGQPPSQRPWADTEADETMREATRCVRRFAPNNKRKMKPGLRNSGHITACKISDARPNELIASWSGDYIYSFDIVQSPDARDAGERRERVWQRSEARHRADRKKKRAAKAKASQGTTSETTMTDHPLQRVPDEIQEDGHTALRVRHGNGETESITVDEGAELTVLTSRDSLLSEAQRQAQRVAASLVRLRKTLFDFSAVLNNDDPTAMESSSELTPFTANLTNALGQACALLPEMEEIMSNWTYPLNPSPEQVELQNTLRRNRQSAWRFVQAAGVIANTLGGRLVTMSSVPDPRLSQFDMIRPAPREKITDEARFYYDFLKAILLWLKGGASAVLDGFRPSSSNIGSLTRFPFDEGDNTGSISLKLETIFSSLADEGKAILDIDANRFLSEGQRHVFGSQTQAVSAFVRALGGVELRTHQGMSESNTDSSATNRSIMDKGAAARFWGIKVGRSLLLEAAQAVNFAFVQQAFGGSQLRVVPDTGVLADGELEAAYDLLTGEMVAEDLMPTSDADSLAMTAPETAGDASDTEMVTPPLVSVDASEETEDRDQSIILEEADEDEDDDMRDIESSDDDDDDDDDDEDSDDEHPYYRARLNFGRPRNRADVNTDVPYSTHTRMYKGHCNTRTVKDVNYYGLDDEYVVSGSDDGHFFIWDRKSSQILNILEGDGEVVNVVQGHPYEPMIACSGIDSTVKIFGPGGNNRERHRASQGIGIANPGGSVHSSLRFGGRTRRTALSEDIGEPDREEDPAERPEVNFDDDQEEQVARNGLKSRRAIQKQYEIMSQNDADRNRGIDEISITDAMLARVAAAMQHRQMQGLGGLNIIAEQAFGETGGTIVVDQDNCSVM